METLTSYTIRNIRESIPRMVLEKAFLSPNPMMFGAGNTLDTAIELAVLRNSVCKDVQVIASLEEVIDLRGLEMTRQPNGGFVVHIPASRTGGRPIISVIKFCFNNTSSAIGGFVNTNDSQVDNQLNRIVDAFSAPIVNETTRCRMVTPNTLVVDLDLMSLSGVSAVVNLEVSENMSHIPKTAWDKFKRMSIEKTKQLAYVNLITALSEGGISRGIESDAITNIINEYSSAYANYNDLYSQWRRTEIFLDEARLRQEIIARLPK
jgi:hypothetical protein